MRLLVLTLLAVTACADSLKSTPVAYAAPSVAAEQATVIFVQQGAYMRWRFLDGKEFIGKTDRGSYFEAQLPPGQHRFYAYHPEGSAWSNDGFCHGFDAELEPGKLYIVMIRFISKMNGVLDETGAKVTDSELRLAQSPSDYDITFRVLNTRGQLGMDASGYFAKLQRLSTDPKLGQAELDAWLPQKDELQHKNLNFKYEVEESKIHKWSDFPSPCTTANSAFALAADKSFPVADFARKPGKRVSFLEKNMAEVAELAERECGRGVAYAVETREGKQTATVRTTQREGAYDVTYDHKLTIKFTGGDVICDQP